MTSSFDQGRELLPPNGPSHVVFSCKICGFFPLDAEYYIWVLLRLIARRARSCDGGAAFISAGDEVDAWPEFRAVTPHPWGGCRHVLIQRWPTACSEFLDFFRKREDES